MRVKGSQKAECGLFGFGLIRLISETSVDLMPVASNPLTSTFMGGDVPAFPKSFIVWSDVFVEWNSMDLMPLASNLLTSTAFAAQLTQLIQARLSKGRHGFALFSIGARGWWRRRFCNG